MKPDDQIEWWFPLAGLVVFCFVALPVIAVCAVLGVRFTLWILFATGLLS